MPSPLLLALLLAGTQDSLSEVRLEPGSAEAAGLVAAAGLVPGVALEPESVRHAVELLFATGRYEDVRVRRRETPEGSALTFELRPAPLLQAVVVEGPAVLSPGRVRELARLRLGEALWPARLARAEHDVALALAAEGWLEARVQARLERGRNGSARAVFKLQPGARVRVRRLRLLDQGRPQEASSLRVLAGPGPGRVFRREQAQAAAERMRRQLLGLGRWRAQVQARERYAPELAVMDLDFEIEPGPFVQVEYQGASLGAGLRGSVERLLREGGLTGDVIEQGAERIEAALHQLGQREAAVSHREEPRPGRLVLVYEVRAGATARVASVAVRGAEEVEPALRPALASLPDTPLDERTLALDTRALQDALLERGYLRARVEASVPDGGGSLPVVFDVRPGPRTLVADVGVTLSAPAPLSAKEAAPPLRLRPGEPYRERELALDRGALLSAYRNAGYLQAEVTPQVRFAEDRGEASVRYEIEPGARTSVDTIVVAGLQDTRESVVRRELLVREGDPLGLQKLYDSQRRLAALGLFQRVSLRELGPEAGAARSVLVSVAEGPRTTLAYGLGYSEREGARASLEATRRNLFGLDRTLTAFGRYGTRGNRAFLSFREPYLLGRRQELFLTGFREEEQREGFSYIRAGAVVQTARALAERTSLILRYAYQQTRLYDVLVPVDEIDRQFQSSTTSGPSLSVIYDSRDDPIEPGRGRFLSADLQLSAPFLKGDRFLKSYFQVAGFHRLGPRLLLALDVRLGLAATYGDGSPESLPLPDRFFAGGDYSVRGFQTDFVGPLALSSSGQLVPTGGNALLLGSAELRFGLTRKLSLAAFSDNGNVFPQVRDLRPAELRPTAGLGLRYHSPLGPLRVDYGYKLDRRPGEEPGHLHVTIGHAF